MTIGRSIHTLRRDAKLSQEQFAALFGVSQQSVQKWENGDSVPQLDKLVQIAQHFGVSLDALILGNDNRITEELKRTRLIKPQYANVHDWEFYASNLATEYTQSAEEGLDVAAYGELFAAAARLPKDEHAAAVGDALFGIVINAKPVEGYPYLEPSAVEEIRALRKPHVYEKRPPIPAEERLQGAWMGRVCGCMLGKTVEGIHTDELIPFLQETGNYPLHRYIRRSDLTEERQSRYHYPFGGRDYADAVDGMPVDDDTNYTVLYQEIVSTYGRDFTPFDVSRAWLHYQPKDAYCTAERVAFCNFVKGYEPPRSAVYKNPYREWIGAQIRGDYFGYINPGDPETAADMAWRDACISHVKNGIYGEMFVAAMLAVAAETDDLADVIRGGLAQIPYTSRLYEAVTAVVEGFEAGVSGEACLADIHRRYDEHTAHGWCHTIPNAMIVAAALLYGGGDYGRSICMAVQTGFDTDCNGATVGSVLGMAYGIRAIPPCWTAPIGDTLHTSIFGVGTVKISERVRLTMEHIR